jgi:Glycosyl hydrolases family 2
MQQVERITLSPWSLWFDDAADWRDGPQSVAAAIDGDIDAWKVAEPTPGWSALDQGVPVVVPTVTDQERPGYHGVSWWSTEVDLPTDCAPIVKFGAARLLAEVFWDRELIGIDLEGYTPFQVVVPERLGGSGRHRIDVRITNPGGAVGWEDLLPFSWGQLQLPSSHDFGGLWQPVTLELATSARIVDVWARPSRDLDAAIIDVAVDTAGAANLQVDLFGPDDAPIASTKVAIADAGAHAHSLTLAVANPALYGPGTPNLYRAVASLSDDGSSDQVSTRFGFRLLDAEGTSLQYNGKPFFLRSAISWSRYSDGPVASEQELRNEVESLLALGQNAISAHRRLATPALADALEQAGLLLYQEPGGMASLRTADSRWLPDTQIADTVRLMEKRIRRLARRDRSRACLVWWNLGNEVTDLDDGDPGPIGWQFLRALREEDDSRITTFASAWNPTPMYRPFLSESKRSFDYHTVLNWPAAWHQDVADNYAALRPPYPMPMLSGESMNMDGLGWLPRQAEGISTERGETAAVRQWLHTLDADLSQLDPCGRLGGARELCAATTANQTYGIARMIESNRANPDIDGLAINAWHSHTTIGTMGMTGPDRRLTVDPEPIRLANAEIAVAIQGIRPVLSVGDSQRVSLVILDDTHACAGEVEVRLSQSSAAGRGARVEEFRVTLPQTGDRVRHVADVELDAVAAGLVTVDVTIVVGGRSASTQATFRGVGRPRLDGVPLAVHDPKDRLSRFVSESGIAARRWHTYIDAPVLFTGTNLDPWAATMSGPATRAICVLDSHPSGEGSGSFMGMRTYGFDATSQSPTMDETLSPLVAVTGHWIGGWGLTIDPQIIPTLSGTSVWDWTVNSILPAWALQRGGVGHALTAAITFPAGEQLSMSNPRVCATTLLLERGERQMVVTTLPLIDNADRDPLAAAVLADLIRWAADRPNGTTPGTGVA